MFLVDVEGERFFRYVDDVDGDGGGGEYFRAQLDGRLARPSDAVDVTALVGSRHVRGLEAHDFGRVTLEVTGAGSGGQMIGVRDTEHCARFVGGECLEPDPVREVAVETAKLPSSSRWLARSRWMCSDRPSRPMATKRSANSGC